MLHSMTLSCLLETKVVQANKAENFSSRLTVLVKLVFLGHLASDNTYVLAKVSKTLLPQRGINRPMHRHTTEPKE